MCFYLTAKDKVFILTSDINTNVMTVSSSPICIMLWQD